MSSGRRGHFVRLAVYVDLRKPLVSKIKISGHIQTIEYESLLIVCLIMGYLGTILICVKRPRTTHLRVVWAGRDLMRSSLAKVGKVGQKDSFMGKKWTSKNIGKRIVIGGRPRTSPNVLRPTNSNIGSSANNGGNGSNDGSGRSPTECSNAVVQNYENSNVQRKKPPDSERGVTTSSMVELSMTMEDIVQLIEQESDAELRTEVLLSSVEVMVDDDSGNNEYLDSLAKTIVEPCVLAKDFNLILEHSERAGGATSLGKNNNKVEGLKIDVGEWCFDEQGQFPLISSTDKVNLEVGIGDEEVRKAIFAVTPWKAPGFDGMVRQVLEEHQLNLWINRTLLVLLPKVQSPKKIMQFRLISLCMVLYKFVRKVIINLLRPLMGSLDKHNQASFVLGKCISDNIVVAQEVVHSMWNFKGKKMEWLSIL
ncbi:hypothetical protein Goklo_017772, partial [Gossypium klotzschianum]|nr:hypothetical protein [Gossypium klotzschianum]